ncbi:MAG: hypothetical protein JWN52_6231 [Actinomycetia bacterium]|nr:hypothetical protein [Actinomycetes bacterium]
MNRRVLLASATWAATAGIAIAAGTAAISVLGEGITDRTVKPMTSAEVQRALAEPYQGLSTAPLPSPAPSPSFSPSRRSSSAHPVTAGPAPRMTTPQAAGMTSSLASVGGDVIVRCVRGSAYLISWTPAQGYATGSVGRGPAVQVSIRFQAPGRQVTMIMSCRNGQPVLDATYITHGHGKKTSGDQGNQNQQ